MAEEAKAADVEMKDAEKKEETKPEEAKEETKEEAKEETKEAAKEETKEEAKEEANGESKEENGKEAKKEPEKPKETEEDAAEESRPKLSPGQACISATTLNVMQSGQFLMSLTEGGAQYLLAGARSTVGVKSGRYMFEARIVESHKTAEHREQGRVPKPNNILRIGLSTSGSSLLLGDGSSDNVCFDSAEGFLLFEKAKNKAAKQFNKDQTMGLLINLEEGSPNANTISLFKNGARISEPQPIPEKLRGKPLFPTLTYRNMTVQVNFGPVPLSPLPFNCNMVGAAAQADVEVAEASAPKNGEYEVVFPVGLPGEGYFDWLDQFLEQNPSFTELSDRKIIEWAERSGLSRAGSAGGSNDKPDAKFGVGLMDDWSVRRLLSVVTPAVKRNYIIPELKGNLLAGDRAKALQRFANGYKRTSVVIVGEPSADYKAKVQEATLAEKKEKAAQEAKKKADEEKRKKESEQRRKVAELRRQIAQAKRKKEDSTALEEEMKAAEEPLPEVEAMEVDVELTEEEKGRTHRKTAVPDMLDNVLTKNFANFTLPSKEEGFDEIRYQWSAQEAADKVVKDWIFAKKLIQRADDIKPGEWFKEQSAAFTKLLQEWRKRANVWKDPGQKKRFLEKRAEDKKKAAKEAEEKGEEPPKEDPKDLDVEDIDVFAVEDVMDLGTGEPLFGNFKFEDWVLLTARYELHLLMHSFKKDLNDPDRTKIPEKDLGFYYNRYFKKSWSLKNFNVEKLSDLADLVKEVLKFPEGASCLECVSEEDTPPATFLKMAEEHRRERQRRVDAGDETADLKFPRQAPAGPPPGRGGAPSSGGSRPSPWTNTPRGSAGQGQKRAYTPPPQSSYVSKAPRYGGGGGAYRR